MRGRTATYECQCCGNGFTARVADRKRGWARFCSKSCKAKRQTQTGRKNGLPRPNGITPMLYKICHTCGDPAVNGVHHGDRIEWYCQNHEYDATLHPFDSEALGQW